MTVLWQIKHCFPHFRDFLLNSGKKLTESLLVYFGFRKKRESEIKLFLNVVNSLFCTGQNVDSRL